MAENTLINSGIMNCKCLCAPSECCCGAELNSQPLQSSMNFRLVNNSGGLGRVDGNTSFRPISGPKDVDPPVLQQSYNILTLQGIRSDTLDKTVSPDKKCNKNAANFLTSFMKPNDFGHAVKVEPETQSFLTPDSFIKSKKVIENGISSKNTIHGLDLSQTPDSIGESRSNASSRATPLTCDDFTSRLVAPEEFMSAGSTLQEKTLVGSSELSTLSTLKNLTLSSSQAVPVVDTNRNGDAPITGISFESNNPLELFCSQIRITPDHNSILPSIPGGKEKIIPRLTNPDQTVLEKLRQSQAQKTGSNSAADMPSESDTDVTDKLLVPMSSLPHKPAEGDKPTIAVFWDIENCQVGCHDAVTEIDASYKVFSVIYI